MAEPPSPWELQRQISKSDDRIQAIEDRILLFQREFVTAERLDRELRHIMDDIKDITASQKETTVRLETAITELSKQADNRIEDARRQRLNLSLLVLGWAVSLIVAVVAPVVVAQLIGK